MKNDFLFLQIAYEYLVVGGGIFKHVYILHVALLDVSRFCWRVSTCLLPHHSIFVVLLTSRYLLSASQYTTSLKTTYESKRFISKQNLILVHQLRLWYNYI